MAGVMCGSGLCSERTGIAVLSINGTNPGATLSRDPTEAANIEWEIKYALGRNYFGGEEFIHQARQNAMQWMLNEDLLQLDSSQPQHLLQRFLLVLLFFQTTRYMPWTECGPREGTTSLLCYTPEDSPYGSMVWGNKWLSDSHECQWAGVTCTSLDGGRFVTELTLCE